MHLGAFNLLKFGGATGLWKTSIALFAALVALTWHFSPACVSEVKLESPQKAGISLPYTYPENEQGVYLLSATLSADWRTPPHLSIAAEDLIESVSLNGKVLQRFTSWPSKFCRINLPPGLPEGNHALEIQAHYRSRFGWIDIRQAHGLSGVGAAFLFLGGAAWFLLMRRAQFSLWSGWLGALALVLGYVYFMSTGPWVRQNDVDGHREYISHLLQHSALPLVKQGWETWQPPFYYIIAALWVKFWSGFSSLELFRQVQLMSYAAYLTSAALAIFFWRQFGFSKGAGMIGLAAFLFLPAHVYLSGKINNDALMPLWGALATALSWRYFKNGTSATLLALAFALCAALATKSSALSLCLGAGLAVLLADYRSHRPFKERVFNALILAWPSVVWFSFWCLRNRDQTENFLYVNANLPSNMLVENAPSRFLSFAPSIFWKIRSIYSSDVRESLPSALYLSVFNGDFNFDHLAGSFWPILPAAFLPLAALFAIGLFAWPRHAARPAQTAASLMFWSHALFMLSYAIQYPYSCNQDARLWAPVFFPAAMLISCGCETALRWVRRGHFFLIAGLGFLMAASLLYYYVSVLFF